MRVITQRAAILSAFVIISWAATASHAVEVLRLSEANWDNAVPEGKEVDCIYGDWVLRNDRIVVVIADAVPTRHANMTVRNVGGAVIDLTLRDAPAINSAPIIRWADSIN